MARTRRSAILDSRTKRLSLKVNKRFLEPIQAGAYLLYNRPLSGAAGTWYARWYDSESKKQRQTKLGVADDYREADGRSTLNYKQAHARALDWFKSCEGDALLEAEGEVARKGPYRVEDAVRDYLEAASRRGMKGLAITQSNVQAHILPALGSIEVAKLTKRRIERWHATLADTPRRRTGKARSGAEHLPAPATEDEKRRRRNTANRILTILKAALNHARSESRVTGDPCWRDVRPFQSVTVARSRFLSIQDQQALVAACSGCFKRLVQAALFTGARYGELGRLKVADFDSTAGTLYVEISKGGTARHICLTPEAVNWFQGLTAGRGPDDLLLRNESVQRNSRHGHGQAWAAYDQRDLMAKACEAAKLTPLTFHELRHTYASSLVNAGVPLAFVASQLGHSSTRMVERYYGHLSPSAQAQAIRSMAPELGITDEQFLSPSVGRAS